MLHLGDLRGIGTVQVNGAEVGSIGYKISVWLDEVYNVKSADGIAVGDGKALFKAFNAGSAELALEDGGRVTMIVTKINQGGAEFQISGPVPGY